MEASVVIIDKGCGRSHAVTKGFWAILTGNSRPLLNRLNVPHAYRTQEEARIKAFFQTMWFCYHIHEHSGCSVLTDLEGF